MPGLHPEHIHIGETGLFQPLELIEQARGLVDITIVGIAVHVPPLALEVGHRIQVAVDRQRTLSHRRIPCLGRQLGSGAIGWRNHIGDQEDAFRLQQLGYILKQLLLLGTIQVVDR